MIVKTFRHKRDYFHRLVPYILSDKGQARSENFDTIFHNLHSIEPDQVIQEFKANDQYRVKRKNGVLAYHEILSFSPKSTPHLNKTILQDIAQQYIELRGVKALCLAQAHVETDHIHLHFLFSGVEYRNSKTLRLDNQSFRALRTSIESYQRQHYPALEASLVYDCWHRSKDPALEKTTGKAVLLKELNRLNISKLTLSRLEEKIASHPALSIHTYRGKPNGIKFNNKTYRFKTLGIELQKEKNIDKSR